MELFLVAPPGLEHVVADEARELLGRDVEQQPGGVLATGDLVDAAGLCLWARTPARVRVVAARFRAASLQQLQQETRKIDWTPFLRWGQAVKVRGTLKDAPRIRRTDAAVHKAQVSIQDAVRAMKRGKPGRYPTVDITLQVHGKDALLSVDAGGLLHKRGYRQATAKAPLRENLACCVLRAAGWQPGVPLADPMCGAGTFSLEAGLWAQDAAPGLTRAAPDVTRWPGFDGRAWKRMLTEAKAARSTPDLPIWTADRTPGAVTAARSNATRAGVVLDVVTKDVREAFPSPPTGPGLVVLNPPYGIRVAENVKLAGLYGSTGKALRAQFPGWRVAAVCPDKALAGRLGKDMEAVTHFDNGGIKVGLFLGQL